jgi:hypothetical protein
MKLSKEYIELNSQALCRDFIRLHMKGKVAYDPIQASVYMHQQWGIKLDWHEMSMALDSLNTKGEVKVVAHNRDGMCRYVNI